MTQKQTFGTHQHVPVMPKEAVAGLNIKPEGLYVDATYGRGGYTQKIMSFLNEKGNVIAFDKDLEAVKDAQVKYTNDTRFQIFHSSFASLKKVLEEHYDNRKVDGVVYDFGVSSPQLDDAKRGFSFSKEGPLDMRMNQQAKQTAASWLEVASERDIAEVLYKYGDEKYSRRIARAIVTRRSNQQPVKTTKDLAELIVSTVPSYQNSKNPATKTFQAIRIFINNEIDEINNACDDLSDVITGGGRVVFITFHSLEHRCIKKFIQSVTAGNETYTVLTSVMTQRKQPVFKRIGKAVRVSNDEMLANRRSRSAWMRIMEKLSCQNT